MDAVQGPAMKRLSSCVDVVFNSATNGSSGRSRCSIAWTYVIFFSFLVEHCTPFEELLPFKKYRSLLSHPRLARCRGSHTQVTELPGLMTELKRTSVREIQVSPLVFHPFSWEVRVK